LLIFLSLLAFDIFASNTDKPFDSSPFGPFVHDAFSGGSEQIDLTKNNYISILDSGYEALLARIHLIRNAKKTINIQTFIWTNDEVGRLVMYELIEAAKRGVKVKIIADQMFSGKDPAVIAFLATVSPNLEVRHYRPGADNIDPSFWEMIISLFGFKDINQRMHNKIMIFDSVVGITGGRNFENTYFDFSSGLNFKDRDALVIGPAVPPMMSSFDEFWGYDKSVPSLALNDVRAIVDSGQVPVFSRRSDFKLHGYFDELEIAADNPLLIREKILEPAVKVEYVKFLSDIPGKNNSSWFGGSGEITKELKKEVSGAQSTIDIQTPYLVLSKYGIDLFKKLRKARPDVKINISTNSYSSTDNMMSYGGNYKLRGVFIKDLDFNVREFMPYPAELKEVLHNYPFLLKLAVQLASDSGQAMIYPSLCMHAKTFVVDGYTTYVGSYNLDPRSANLNTEVGLLIKNAPIAKKILANMKKDNSGSNSWVIARKEIPLPLERLNDLLEGLSNLSPLDIWAVRSTSSFKLIEGKEEVPVNHPDFYDNYADAGNFPGADPLLTDKEIIARLFKVFGNSVIPILSTLPDSINP
jgi:phosphatidylserine/phosphatidylglycerophosphate/cardiolipin synthase-like enzyme